jgi:hypothetical protein
MVSTSASMLERNKLTRDGDWSRRRQVLLERNRTQKTEIWSRRQQARRIAAPRLQRFPLSVHRFLSTPQNRHCETLCSSYPNKGSRRRSTWLKKKSLCNELF